MTDIHSTDLSPSECAPAQTTANAETFASTSQPTGLVSSAVLSTLAAAALTACGGGDSADQAPAGLGERASAAAVAISDADYFNAWRFLQQASMGPTEAEVNAVINRGIEQWLVDQMALPPYTSTNYDAYPKLSWAKCYDGHSGKDEYEQFDTSPEGKANGLRETPPRPYGSIKQPNWERFMTFVQWNKPIDNVDQLRHRVVHALSQFLVISLRDDIIGMTPYLAAGYLDMLTENAFGSFRTLIEGVVTSPAMGHYLSHFANKPPTFAKNAAGQDDYTKLTGVPDQNFARELIQLFTIGLTQLKMDGSEILVGDQPVPTTGPMDIPVLSNVFTGWGYNTTPEMATTFTRLDYVDPSTADEANAYTSTPNAKDDVYDTAPDNFPGMKLYYLHSRPTLARSRRCTVPMVGYKTFRTRRVSMTTGAEVWFNVEQVHSTQTMLAAQLKVPESGVNLLGKKGFKLGGDPNESMRLALDVIFAHPNLAPFVSKQMIQHLVTSNPSKAYVQRVATAFKASTNWDMKVLIKAILLDTEARQASIANTNTFGRLREPYLRVLGMMRGIGLVGGCLPAETNNIADTNYALNLNHSPLRAPSVFNDFSPRYQSVGGQMEKKGLVTPQMQIATETSVLAYINAIYQIIDTGLGQYAANIEKSGVLNISKLVTSSSTATDIVDIINRKLFGKGMSAELKSIVAAAAKGSAPAESRFKAALFTAVISTEYLVQR